MWLCHFQDALLLEFNRHHNGQNTWKCWLMANLKWSLNFSRAMCFVASDGTLQCINIYVHYFPDKICTNIHSRLKLQKYTILPQVPFQSCISGQRRSCWGDQEAMMVRVTALSTLHNCIPELWGSLRRFWLINAKFIQTKLSCWKFIALPWIFLLPFPFFFTLRPTGIMTALYVHDPFFTVWQTDQN